MDSSPREEQEDVESLSSISWSGEETPPEEVKAAATAEETEGNSLYDSVKEAAYVGLRNQGATCYMNSLLQIFYHLPYFRKVVYRMPTTVNQDPSKSIAVALQSLFYKLQFGKESVSTQELTKSFGWDITEAFLQHDVQEFNRILCEKLEQKMERTVVEGEIRHLFEGHHMNFIECIDVDYKSCRTESFYDLQLDVKGCHDVYDSFDKYVAVEHLEGDNKYHAEQYGLQDAKKGVLFRDFPPVLQLQLKRFEYDFVQNIMVKINDCYKFPLQLDLDKENGKYLSPEADRSVRNLYTLHSVLVHRGDVHRGHYYAFINPALSSDWYKFDDERVTKEDMRKALPELYGVQQEHLVQTTPEIINAPCKFRTSAYMLVYVRESDKDKIMCSVAETDIAEHLRERLKREQEEKEQQKKLNLTVVYFRSIEKPKEDEFCLLLSRLATYDEVTGRVAHHLGVDDPTKIRLTSQDLYTQLPRTDPIEYRGVDNLLQMLLCYSHISNILYYEVLDIPLPELQRLRTLKIAFCRAANNDMDINDLRLPKESTVGDLLDDLRMMVDLSSPNAELRLMKVFMNKILKIFAPNESIMSLNDKYGTFRAEEICEEEKNLGPLDCLIRVHHFEAVKIEKQMQIRNFGVPFLLVIHENEVLAHIKLRVQKKLNVPDDEFSKWKFAVVSKGQAEYLQDSDIMFSSFKSRDVTSGPEDRAACSLCRGVQKRARKDKITRGGSKIIEDHGDDLAQNNHQSERDPRREECHLTYILTFALFAPDLPTSRSALSIGGVWSDTFPTSSDPLSMVVRLLKASITLCSASIPTSRFPEVTTTAD
ncbi:hypothetical protein F511_19369 [Dorcoceras hygrometricum]|uniref:Ubiquitin carboxyl-terminal hydrolase n=1 Tax=Dorcoceras hygrometricum TaxID=472368 RepID=A0A2Z7CC36_9LAMI|nr:hypothetical protein F511_19369 [Dorcoceras hygrometricum]